MCENQKTVIPTLTSMENTPDTEVLSQKLDSNLGQIHLSKLQ